MLILALIIAGRTNYILGMSSAVTGRVLLLMLKPFSLLPAIAAVILLALAACSDRGDQGGEPPPPPVEVLVVREQPVIPRFEYVGRVQATDELNVRPRVEGNIQGRYFEEGSLVKEGELLYEIDPQPFIATLENRRAAESRARAALEVAERNFRRGRELAPQGFISKMTMDQLEGDFEQAQANLKAAVADVNSAELNLSYTKIYAPLTGRIGRSSFPEGALVGPQSEPLAMILNTDPVWVVFEVPEDRILSVQVAEARRERAGMRPERRDIRIELPDGSFYPYPGTIAFVDNKVNPNTGSVAVRAEFPNPDQLLIQGQFARVSVRVYGGQEQLKPLVPQSAVLEDMQGRYVFVVDENNIAHRRYLKLGQREGELWAVEEGLKVGETVIVNGLQRVIAEQPVTPQSSARNPYEEERKRKAAEAAQEKAGPAADERRAKERSEEDRQREIPSDSK
ncbi:membrane fusion protein, multidrug efflux system [Microbulbifer donghaiensis]|uniref:Membrane fusion protein, multidrug efflux system n=1 Tax=Microbulbifer donghaiensis TaxID=494016 RepID=A0A1M5G4P4_9GAMM|nr:efflux RND transporter periplasmic adaptor subunit [Microbulbifer donghaiensis]SHF98688.1 membrane fusion protein, multidrug efflux system [Microbulbifer donghaiensis]